jgi:hypothetical protein
MPLGGQCKPMSALRENFKAMSNGIPQRHCRPVLITLKSSKYELQKSLSLTSDTKRADVISICR